MRSRCLLGRCLTSGHLESLGQFWLAVFNSGAGGYFRVMTRSRRLLKRPPSDASRRPFQSTPFQAGMRLRSVIADRRRTGSPHAVQREIDHLFDPRGRTAAGQGGSLPCGRCHKTPEPGVGSAPPIYPTGSGLHRRATERFQMTGVHGYPSCSKALSTIAGPAIWRANGLVGALGSKLGPVLLMIYALCGLVKNNMRT